MTQADSNGLFFRRQPFAVRKPSRSSAHGPLAASIQSFTEEIVLRLARGLQRRTGATNLVMAGEWLSIAWLTDASCGEGPFDDLWIHRFQFDGGGSARPALFVWITFSRNLATGIGRSSGGQHAGAAVVTARFGVLEMRTATRYLRPSPMMRS